MYHQLSIKELRKKLDNKEISSVELFNYFKERIETYDEKINAFITQTFSEALDAAKKADKLIEKGEQTLLTGIPIAHKDNFCTQTILTTAASKMLYNYTPPFDATVVEKLADAGAYSMGKLNMDEFAMGATGQTSFYGATVNPWDETKVPGGSSSGSAAAVASGFVLGATATDTGGSIRQPASFCGLTGIKPTYGLVSRFGMIPLASTLDAAGIVAKSAEDCAILLQAIAGHDNKDPTSISPPQAFTRLYPLEDEAISDSDKPLKGLKLGVPTAFFGQQKTKSIHEAALKVYQELGAELIEIELTYHEYMVPTYYTILTAEASSNTARYDGIRYGYQASNVTNIEELYQKTRYEGFGDEVRSRILLGAHLLTEGNYDHYYLQAQKVRRLIAEEFQHIFTKVDLIVGPSMAAGAYGVESEELEENIGVENSLFDANLIGANLAGLPALSHTVGFTDGLPVGFQLIGNHFEEAKILRACHYYQLVTKWHKEFPQGFSS